MQVLNDPSCTAGYVTYVVSLLSNITIADEFYGAVPKATFYDPVHKQVFLK